MQEMQEVEFRSSYSCVPRGRLRVKHFSAMSSSLLHPYSTLEGKMCPVSPGEAASSPPVTAWRT